MQEGPFEARGPVLRKIEVMRALHSARCCDSRTKLPKNWKTIRVNIKRQKDWADFGMVFEIMLPIWIANGGTTSGSLMLLCIGRMEKR